MPASPMNSVVEHLRTAVLLCDGAGLGDGELLGGFLERRDAAALAALVKRHGPMVWGVCRRLLSHHDAEDAFQATFLVFVRKATSIVPRSMVGNWLYGVAHQTALQARRTAARRRAREVQVTVMPEPEAVSQDRWLDVQPLLDQELSHLPDCYRAVLVLCDLEGRTRKEAARQLGVPEGTVAGRLARSSGKGSAGSPRAGPTGGTSAGSAPNRPTALCKSWKPGGSSRSGSFSSGRPRRSTSASCRKGSSLPGQRSLPVRPRRPTRRNTRLPIFPKG